MSYDLTIAAHRRPSAETVSAWAASEGLEAAAHDHGFAILQRSGERALEVSGPHPAEPEDFEEELAGACLAPRWMLQVSTPYSAPRIRRDQARALARHLAEDSAGAVFDPQEGRILWPRGKQKRVAPRSAEQETSLLKLEWFLLPSEWRHAVERVVPLLSHHCPEALPTRYGAWEPPPHRFDRARASAFVESLAGEDGGFWYAVPPSFGGAATPPPAVVPANEDERLRVGRIEISFDCNQIAADTRWVEAVTDLFRRGAEHFNAFYAAAQVEPGWIVSRNNRAFAQAASLQESEQVLRRGLWQGLPPVPVWLSWYGTGYTAVVRDAVQVASSSDDRSNAGILQHQDAAARRTDRMRIVESERTLFVRLSTLPLSRTQLPAFPLPSELTYRERRAIEHPDGRETDPAQPGDCAAFIPRLEL